MDEHSEITPIGITNFRNDRRKFGIKDKDRLGHIYIIGKTGTGKSTLIKNMAISDMRRCKGLGVIDPHGDLAEELLQYIPQERKDDLIYFNPKDTEHSIAFNPLHGIHPSHHHLVASGLISTFKKIWIDSWGPRLEYILRFCLHTLLEYPDATLLDIQPLLTNLSFRNHVLLYVKSDTTKSFWKNEYDKYPPQLRSEAISPILNKTGLFLTSIPLRNIVGQKTSSLKIQSILDEEKILIVNLSKGEIGEDASALLGSMLVTSIQLAALHRANQDVEKRKPFYLYIDEMHSFITLAFSSILSEARKYGLALCLTNQYISQLDERIKSSIFGNCGTLIAFRVGAEDAEYLAKEFYPMFNQEDLVSLPRYSIYLRLQIDNEASKPFSADTLHT